MHDRRHPTAATGRPIDESRGGWALFGRLLTWSMRYNALDGDRRPTAR